jgi:hypothetical protein
LIVYIAVTGIGVCLRDLEDRLFACLMLLSKAPVTTAEEEQEQPEKSQRLDPQILSFLFYNTIAGMYSIHGRSSSVLGGYAGIFSVLER